MNQKICIIRPPRSSSICKSLVLTKANKTAPANEIIFVANFLRKNNIYTEIIDADLESYEKFEKKILEKQNYIFIFFIQTYRISSTIKIVKKIYGMSSCLAFGYVTEDFCHTYGKLFNCCFLGYHWEKQIYSFLKKHPIKKAKQPPIIDLHSFEDLIGSKKKAASIQAPAWGCINNCIFCENQINKQYCHPIAFRKVDEVIEDMRHACKQGVNGFVFLENSFFMSLPWVIKFIEEHKKQLPSLPFSIHARMDHIIKAEKNHIFCQLVQRGLYSVCSGLESGNQQILTYIQKDETIEDYLQANAILKKYNLKRFYSIIIGLPHETEKTITDTCNLIKKLAPDHVQISIAVPFPGTPFFQKAKQNFWLKDTNLDHYYYYNHAVIEAGKLSIQKLLQLQKNLYKSLNYKRSFYE